MITHVSESSLSRASSSSSALASSSLAFSLSLASRGNQSCIKFISAQSTLAIRDISNEGGEKVSLVLTSIGNQDRRRSTHRTVTLSTLLHLDETTYAEQVSTIESYWLESNIGTD